MLGVFSETALLAALSTGPGYGLDLIERILDKTGGKLKLSQGSVYPALRELEKGGFLSSYKSNPMPERGGRPRCYYQLTASGRRRVQQEREVICGLFGLTLCEEA